MVESFVEGRVTYRVAIDTRNNGSLRGFDVSCDLLPHESDKIRRYVEIDLAADGFDHVVTR